MKVDFDIAAKNYDSVFTNSKIGKAQRHMVYKYLNPLLQTEKKKSILEVNCGTGEDAIYIAKTNHKITATDISKRMIDVAKSKKNTKENLEFKVQDINSITKNTFKKKFDLIFSNFGGLNCLSPDELTIFINNASNLLNEKGKMVFVIMPKQCLWERIYFKIKGENRKAKRRQTNSSVNANVDGINVKTWYYNPKTISKIAEKKYKTRLHKPIGFFIPPSYLENSILTKKPIFFILKSLDSIFKFSFLSKYADHYLIVLEKK